MRTAYRVIAGLICLEVVIQAAAIAFGVAGLGIWVGEEGGVLDKASMESDEAPFPELVGFVIHGMNGMMVIPLLGLLLLIVSFFARLRGGVVAAAVVLGLIVLQVALGIFGHETAYAGLLHGANALVLFGAAMHATRLARTPAQAPPAEQTPVTV